MIYGRSRRNLLARLAHNFKHLSKEVRKNEIRVVVGVGGGPISSTDYYLILGACAPGVKKYWVKAGRN